MECRIFYSWQTDLPNATNRGFIQSALENAAKSIHDDESIKVEPVVDRDTFGVPGSPDIADTIFEKINRSQIFVADISIINNNDLSRKTPNPNVLIELGYAMKTLGLDKIIIVMNTAYGNPETLPFDLRMRRVVTYSLSAEENEKATERKKLSSIFEQALRSILENLEESPAELLEPNSTLLEKAIQSVTASQPNQKILIRDYVKFLNRNLLEHAPQFPGIEEKGHADEIVIEALDETLEYLSGYSRLAEIIAIMNSKESAIVLTKYFEDILNTYSPPVGFSGSYKNNRMDYFKFIGHELFVIFISFLMRENKWELLTTVLEEGYLAKSVYRNAETVSFERISDYVESLELRNRRLNTNRISIHADILNDRHTKGYLSEICPMDQFIAADFFLYTRSGFDWRPWSTLYLYEHTPRFLIEATRKRFAEQLFQPLKVSSIAELQELLQTRTAEIHKFYGNRGIWRSQIDYSSLISAIGSK